MFLHVLLACLMLAGVRGGPLSNRPCRLRGGECQEDASESDGNGGSDGGKMGRGGGSGQLFIDIGPFFKMWGSGGGKGGADCANGQPCKGGQGGGGLVIEIGGFRFGGGGWGGGGVRRRDSDTIKCETEPCPKPPQERWGGLFGGGQGGFGFSSGGGKQNGGEKGGQGGFNFQFGGNKGGWGGGGGNGGFGWGGSGGKGGFGWGGGGGNGGFGWGGGDGNGGFGYGGWGGDSAEGSTTSSEIVGGSAIRPQDHPGSWESGNKRGNQADDLPNEPAENNDVPLTSEEMGELIDQRTD